MAEYLKKEKAIHEIAHLYDWVGDEISFEYWCKRHGLSLENKPAGKINLLKINRGFYQDYYVEAFRYKSLYAIIHRYARGWRNTHDILRGMYSLEQMQEFLGVLRSYATCQRFELQRLGRALLCEEY